MHILQDVYVYIHSVANVPFRAAVCHEIPLSMGILQARTLKWIALPSSRGSSQPRDQTQVSHIAGRLFTIWATWEGLGAPSPCPVENLHLTLDCPQTYLLIAYYWLEALPIT